MWHKPHTRGHTRILFCVTLFSLESWGMSSLFPELGRVIKSPESTTRLSGPSWWDQLRKPCWSLPSSSEFPGGGVSLLMLWILGKIPPWSLPVHQTAHTSKHIWFHLHFCWKPFHGSLSSGQSLPSLPSNLFPLFLSMLDHHTLSFGDWRIWGNSMPLSHYLICQDRICPTLLTHTPSARTPSYRIPWFRLRANVT